jgi:hypothetical protein
LDVLADHDQPGRFFEENFWASATVVERELLLLASEGATNLRSPRGRPSAMWSAALAGLREQSLLVGGRIPSQSFQTWLLDNKVEFLGMQAAV